MDFLILEDGTDTLCRNYVKDCQSTLRNTAEDLRYQVSDTLMQATNTRIGQSH
jgi:hypothetical protein